MQDEVQTIAAFSEHHRRTEGREKALPTDDEVDALLFFLRRSFYGGRRVELSEEYFDHAKEVITDHRSRIESGLSENQGADWLKPIRRELGAKIENSADCRMVISLLEWLSDDYPSDESIVRRSLDAIEDGKLEDHHRTIRENVHNVGPKKTSLYLRDIVAIRDIEQMVEDNWEYIIPIDTQIERVVTEVIEQDIDADTWKDSARLIADVCRRHSVSPIRFDEGAWYVGANALDILLDSLAEIDPAVDIE